jgi:hypothetical protein
MAATAMPEKQRGGANPGYPPWRAAPSGTGERSAPCPGRERMATAGSGCNPPREGSENETEDTGDGYAATERKNANAGPTGNNSVVSAQQEKVATSRQTGARRQHSRTRSHPPSPRPNRGAGRHRRRARADSRRRGKKISSPTAQTRKGAP